MLTKEDINEVKNLLEPINDRLGSLDKRLNGIDDRLDTHDKKFDAVDKRFDAIQEQLDINSRSILHLENSVMNELRLIREFLPAAVAKGEAVNALQKTVEDHDDRIWA